MRYLLLLSVFAWSLSACDPQRVFEKNYDLKEAKWYADSTLNFRFEIADTAQRYHLYYNIRNSLAYPYYNLYVVYSIEDAEGQSIDEQMHNITLMHDKTGEPFGSGLGDIYEHQLIALPEYHFKKKGTYTVKLKHYMRQNPLPHLLTIGLRIEQVKPQS